jgi:hypothetical protein
MQCAVSLYQWQAYCRVSFDSELVFVGEAGKTEPSRASRRRGIEWNSHNIVAPGVLLTSTWPVSRARYTDHDPIGDAIPGALNRVVSLAVTFEERGAWSGRFNLRHLGPCPLIEDGIVRSDSTTLAYARKLSRGAAHALDD